MKRILFFLWVLMFVCGTDAKAATPCQNFGTLNQIITPLPINAGLNTVSATNKKKIEANKKEAAKMFLINFAYRKLFQHLDKDFYSCRSRKSEIFVIDTAEKILNDLSVNAADKHTDSNIWGAAELTELKAETRVLRKDKNSDAANYKSGTLKSVDNIGAYPEVAVDKTGVPPIDSPSDKMKEGIKKMKKNQRENDGKFTKKDEIIAVIEPFIMVTNAVDAVDMTRERNKKLWFQQRHAISSFALALYLKVELLKLQKLFGLVKNFDTLNDGKKYQVPVDDWNEDLVIHAQLWNIFNRLIFLNQQIKMARLGGLPGSGIIQTDSAYESVITDDRVSGWETNSEPSGNAVAGDIIYSAPEWDIPSAEFGEVDLGGEDVFGEDGSAASDGDGGDVPEEETEECRVSLSVVLGSEYSKERYPTITVGSETKVWETYGICQIATFSRITCESTVTATLKANELYCKNCDYVVGITVGEDDHTEYVGSLDNEECFSEQ